jgi:hypothetical protein
MRSFCWPSGDSGYQEAAASDSHRYGDQLAKALGILMPRRWHEFAVAFGLFLMANSVGAASNLARDQPYVFTPSPTYEHTRDKSDRTQLTDGELAPDTMWMSRKTVGWMATPTPIEIEIDLGDAKDVGSVCMRSARRAEAGVSFPRRVDIFVSAERARYAWAGNLLAGQDTGEGPYLVKRFCSPEFTRKARYIRLLVAAKGSYFFTDEIEVFPPTIIPPGGVDPRARLAPGELRRFAVEHEAISRLVQVAAGRVATGTQPSLRAGRVDDVRRRLVDSSVSLDFEGLKSLEHEMREAIRHEMMADCGGRLCVTRQDPWKPASPLDAPSSTEPAEVDLAGGHRTAIVLGVRHAEPRPLRVRVAADVLDVEKAAIRVRLFEVATVTRADGVRLGDPLRPLPGEELEVDVGESKQLWIALEAPHPSDGNHAIRIKLTAMIFSRPVSWSTEVPVRLWSVAPSPVSPSTVVWGYLNSPPIQGLGEAAAADMLAHGVTTAVLPAADLPWPKVGARTFDSEIGDYRKFDAVMHTLRGHRQFLFFLAFNSDSANRTFGGQHAFLSDSWKVFFKEWIREWSSRLKQAGVGYDRFAFYPIDEPHEGTEQDSLIAIARLIKETDPKIRLYTTMHEPNVLTDPLIKVIDVFQLNGRALNPAVISRLKARGREVWAYSTDGGGKTGHPATFYRAQAWEAFDLGLSGFGFWAYADVGRSGTAWNDIDDARPDYAVIYEGHRSIVSSKRWEAWREGVQDFQMLSSTMANARSQAERNRVREIAKEGRRSLEDLPAFTKVRRRLLEINSAQQASRR